MCLEQNNSLLDRFAANWAAVNLITAHLAGSVTAQEHHVTDAIEADRAHRLLLDILQLLLQLLDVIDQVQIARSRSTGDGTDVVRGGQRSGRSVDASHVRGHCVVHRHAVSAFVNSLKEVLRRSRFLLFIPQMLYSYDISRSSATDRKWDLLIDLRSTLNALLHDLCAVIARHHVSAGFEEHGSLSV